MAPSAIRDRIVELRRVRASELAQNPRNWRRHPPEQARALRSVLEQVGYADALLARETPDGLELIDGHLRAETTPDAEVPVLVLDVTQAEADLILATLDPLAAMADVDTAALEALLASVTIDSAELAAHLASYTGNGHKEGLTDPDEVPTNVPGWRRMESSRFGSSTVLTSTNVPGSGVAPPTPDDCRPSSRAGIDAGRFPEKVPVARRGVGRDLRACEGTDLRDGESRRTR